jgi:hypothetical protein
MLGETSEEVEAHIVAQDFDDISDIQCWGVMVVGSQVWIDWVSGIHPMTLVMGMVSATLMEHPQILVEIFEED